jgi:quercetin dioxygenase-like cupin family protein
MAKSGDVVDNPVTRERMVWRKVARDGAGDLLQADLTVGPGGFAAAEHVHPKQEERFEVLAGTLQLRLDGKEKTMRAGDVAVVPTGRPHVWWNGGDEELHVLLDLRPALRTEMFFETLFGLAKDGKTNRKGLPNPLQLAVLAREYQDELHLARPPLGVQKVLFSPLAMLGRLLGYRGYYPQYSAQPLTKGSGSAARSGQHPTST